MEDRGIHIWGKRAEYNLFQVRHFHQQEELVEIDNDTEDNNQIRLEDTSHANKLR